MLHCIASQLAALLSVRSDADFASHCLHTSSLHLLLHSYLHHASQLSTKPPPDYSIIAESVYLVFHRFASVAPAASLAATPFVSVPLLLHFASLYSPAMAESTTAIVDRLMAAKPSLVPQLSALCLALTQSLDGLRSALSLPAPLSFTSHSVAFLSATFASLHALFACTPSCPSTAPFAAHASFLSTSARLYERLCQIGREQRDKQVVSSISECRRVTLSALHAIIDRAMVQPLLRESGDVPRLSEAVFQLIADCHQHTPTFLSHYTHLFRLSADMKKVTALPAVVAALTAPRVSQLLSFLPAAPSAVPLPTASLFRSRSTEAREEQSIAELRAMFDNAISDDFARACLREYNGELDVSLQHIFDNALPARLQSVSAEDRRHWQEDGDGGEAAEVGDRQGNMLDEDESSSSFQQYLLRTGRVAKPSESDKAALSRSSLSLFEADASTKAMLKERIIASQALDALYDDELDDSYSSFLSFAVDETAIDLNDRTDGRGRPQHDRSSRATAGDRAGGGGGGEGGGEDVRARWRKETEEREARRDEELTKRIELIPPSRRTAEEKMQWERLKPHQQLQHEAQPPSAVGAAAGRGMRGMRARGGQLPRGGGGRGGFAGEGGDVGAAAAAAAASSAVGGAVTSGARYVDGSLGPPREAPHALSGRGRGRGSAPALSFEQKETERNRRVQQAAKDKVDRARRLNSDEEDGEDESGEEDEMDLDAQAVLSRGGDASADGGQGGRGGGDADGGGRGRGRGNDMRHTHGSGPRNSAGGGGRGGRGGGRGHNARGAHKAAAMRKMNGGMMRG